MEREKIKFMCVASSGDFTKGKIYEGYETGVSYLKDDTGYVFSSLSVDDFNESEFIPLRDIAFVIRCTETQDNRFKIGELYFVLKDGVIYGDSMDFSNRNFKTYEDWYDECVWTSYSFYLVEDYTDKEENKMSNLEKLGIVKGVEEESIKNVFKAITDKSGKIILQPVKMVNLCFVQHDNSDKIYVFENPSDKRLKAGTKVKVDTKYGEKDATVVASIKLQKKYLKYFMLAFTGSYKTELKKVLGYYKIELIEREYCEDLVA
ncbi:MAG: hypothetical protein PUE66_07840 [Erysipelotrichaceae bacterium]|nr:hypothetical protein [Erysipelotrichaceae bacterium]